MKLFETFHRSWSNLGKFFPSEFVSNQDPLVMQRNRKIEGTDFKKKNNIAILGIFALILGKQKF